MKQDAPATLIASLERLVGDDEDLLTLESIIGKFNVFDALRVARTEIRHSNFLAWLLDPSESHGRGQLFLKALLSDVLRRMPHPRPIEPLDLDGTDLRGVDVHREWEHIDILITSEQPALVIAIENKIDSAEHGDQIQRYTDAIASRFPGKQPLLVYLTTDSTRCSHGDWANYSYQDVHRVIDRCRRFYSGAVQDDVSIVIDHYLRLIGSWYMDDPAIDRLCRRIYKNHRQALDLIFQRIKQEPLWIMDAVYEAVAADPELYAYRLDKEVGFAPKEWVDHMEPVFDPEGNDNWREIDRRAWLQFYFDIKNNELRWNLWPGMTIKPKERIALLEKALKEIKGLKQPRNVATADDNLATGSVLSWQPGSEPEEAKVKAAVRTTITKLRKDFDDFTGLLRELGQSNRSLH